MKLILFFAVVSGVIKSNAVCIGGLIQEGNYICTDLSGEDNIGVLGSNRGGYENAGSALELEGDTVEVYKTNPLLSIEKKDSTRTILVLQTNKEMKDEYATLVSDATIHSVDTTLAQNSTPVTQEDGVAIINDGTVQDGTSEHVKNFISEDDRGAVDEMYPKEQVFNVYPNPFNDFIKIDNHNKISRVVVSNIVGQHVIDIKYPEAKIQTGELTTGVYIVSLIADDKIVKSTRLIKR